MSQYEAVCKYLYFQFVVCKYLRFYVLVHKIKPGPDFAVPVAARFKAWVCGRSLARWLGLWVRIPPGAWMFVCCGCEVQVSATGWTLVHSPTVYGMCECDREASKVDVMTRRRAEGPQGEKKKGGWVRTLLATFILFSVKCYIRQQQNAQCCFAYFPVIFGGIVYTYQLMHRHEYQNRSAKCVVFNERVRFGVTTEQLNACSVPVRLV